MKNNIFVFVALLCIGFSQNSFSVLREIQNIMPNTHRVNRAKISQNVLNALKEYDIIPTEKFDFGVGEIKTHHDYGRVQVITTNEFGRIFIYNNNKVTLEYDKISEQYEYLEYEKFNKTFDQNIFYELNKFYEGM